MFNRKQKIMFILGALCVSVLYGSSNTSTVSIAPSLGFLGTVIGQVLAYAGLLAA